MPIYLLRACNGVFAMKAYGGGKFPGKFYKCVQFNVISSMRGEWVSTFQKSVTKVYSSTLLGLHGGFIDVEFAEKSVT